MNIVTVSREFGSGGREVGKRLADELGIAYYDREIISAVAEKSPLNESYIERTLESGRLRQFPITFSRTFSYLPSALSDVPQLLGTQNKVLRDLAESGDCVIVGRAANTVLKDFDPFNLFVYADMDAKISRCRARSDDVKNMSDREIERMIRRVDKVRAENHSLISDYPWGDKRGYHLCVNTSGFEIKSIVPMIAKFAENWFKEKQ